MKRNYKLEQLLRDKVIITKEYGNSMTPLLTSGQEHELTHVNWKDVSIGDIVYCKVKGKFYTHLVKAKNTNRGCLIGNNHGRINGWTKNIYGKVTNKF